MAIVTPTQTQTVVGYPFHLAKGAKAAQNDFLVFGSGVTGIIPLAAVTYSNATGGATNDSFGYAEVCVDASSGLAATITAIPYDGATANTRTSGGFFVKNGRSGEIMYVRADSGYTTTSGTLTVDRGALGTTAAAISNNDYLFVMNSLKLTGSATGTEQVAYLKYPEDPKATFL